MKRTIFTVTCLLLLASLLALFSCGKKEEVPEEKEETVFSEAVWDSGVKLTVYSESQKYVELLDFISELDAQRGESAEWYPNDYATGVNSIIFGESEASVSKTAYNHLRYLIEEISTPNTSAWLIYASGSSVALAYSSDYAFLSALEYFSSNFANLQKFDPDDGVLASEKIDDTDFVEKKRNERLSESINSLEDMLGAGAVDALEKLYTLYDTSDYMWLADLWDPVSGGFYYSNSARDSIGYYPDLESTGQALQYLENTGMIKRNNLAAYLPEDMMDKIAGFVVGLQSESDGYFYHPQWGESVGTSRRGRDLGWAKGLLEYTGAQPLYDTPDGEMKGTLGAPGAVATSSHMTRTLGASSVVAVSRVVAAASNSYLPEYLKSVEKFKEYIATLNIPYSSYGAGNTLNAQYSQIISADRTLWLSRNPGATASSYDVSKPAKGGYVEYLFDYLAEIQDPSTGLFEAPDSKNDAYYRVDGLMKCGTLYSYFRQPFPNAMEAFQSCIDVILIPDGHGHVCSVYNPWIAMKVVMGAASGDDPDAMRKEMRQIAIDNAEVLIENTFNKLTIFKMDNGSFTYFRNQPCNVSQGAKVACATEREATVNALGLCSAGVTGNIAAVLGFSDIKLFGIDELKIFMNYLVSLGKIEKFEAPPLQPVNFDNYEPLPDDVSGVAARPDDYVRCEVRDSETVDGKYKWFGSSVVKNPTEGENTEDYVLKTNVYTYPGEEKTKGDIMSLTAFESMEDAIGANCYIFESDILIMDANTNVISQMNFSSKHSDPAFGVSFYGYLGEDGKKYVRLYDRYPGLDGVANQNLVDGIPMGEWFNMRIELYRIPTVDEFGKTTVDVIAQIFINGDYACESYAGYIKSGETTYANDTISEFRYHHYRHWDSETYFNNSIMHSVVKDYEEIKPATPVTPDGTHTFDDGKNNKLVTELNSEGSKESIIRIPDKEGYVLDKAVKVTSGDGVADYVRVYNNDENKGYSKAVFSTELRLDYDREGLGSARLYLGIAGSDDAYILDFIINPSERGIALRDFSSEGYGETVKTSIRQNTWFEFRLEYYKISHSEVLALVYINDSLVYVSDNFALADANAIPVSDEYVTADGNFAKCGLNEIRFELGAEFCGEISFDNVRFEKEKSVAPEVSEESYTSRYHADSAETESVDEGLDFEDQALKNEQNSISGIKNGMTENRGTAEILKVEDVYGSITNALVVGGRLGDVITLSAKDSAGATRFRFSANLKITFASTENGKLELVFGSTSADTVAAYRLIIENSTEDGCLVMYDETLGASSANVGDKVKLSAKNGEWLKISVEYYKLSQNEILVITYVNGEPVYVSDNVASPVNVFGTAWNINGSYTAQDGYKVEKGLNAVKFIFTDDETTVALDNLIAIKEIGEHETVDEEDYNSRFHKDSGGTGGGGSFTPDDSDDVEDNIPEDTWH